MEKPSGLGFRMPAEWEEHESTWLSWPKNPFTFPDDVIEQVEETYLEVIAALTNVEKVNLLVDNEKQEERVRGLMTTRQIREKNLQMHRITTGDVWFRDYGPIFVTRLNDEKKEVAYTHWRFNAWGGKYDDEGLKHDESVVDKMPINLRRFDAPMVLEGGSIDVNGTGGCITTEQCLLNKNRNPDLDKRQIEGYLNDFLGIDKVTWLTHGIAGDDTDGHVDDIARFVAKDSVVCAFEENADDENYEALMNNYKILKDSSLKVTKLPMPGRVEYHGRRLPASYTNFYIANGIVLLPTFNDDNDKVAVSALKKLFKGRKIIRIDSTALVVGFGAIHCATQQQPA